MDLQERYDELDEIISSIDLLVDSITDKDYIDDLNEIKFSAQNELEEIEEELQKELEKELEAEKREMNYQFERERL